MSPTCRLQRVFAAYVIRPCDSDGSSRWIATCSNIASHNNKSTRHTAPFAFGRVARANNSRRVNSRHVMRGNC